MVDRSDAAEVTDMQGGADGDRAAADVEGA
jgi:hypothetical protein